MGIKLETLNEQFKKHCLPGYSNYIKIDENKIIIPNFFKDFEKAQQFFTKREKWEVHFCGNAKPGIESIFPNWIAGVILEKYFIENSVVDDMNSYSTISMFFYDGMKVNVNDLSSNAIFPHVDSIVTDDNCLGNVCLVNLNNFEVTTKFWKYKNKSICNGKIEKKEYDNFVNKKSMGYAKLSFKDKENFLKNTPEIKIEKEISYQPNEALIYPLNLYHSSKVEKVHTKLNPRILLRLMYDAKIN